MCAGQQGLILITSGGSTPAGGWASRACGKLPTASWAAPAVVQLRASHFKSSNPSVATHSTHGKPNMQHRPPITAQRKHSAAPQQPTHLCSGT